MNNNKAPIVGELDKAAVEKWFNRYPKLEAFICAGTVSLKMSRDLLLIDRYEMYDIYLELVEANAVYPSGSNCFRASAELKQFVLSRRAAQSETK